MDAKCLCKNWARDSPPLWTGHHPDCPKYDAAEEVRAVIEPLLDGMEAWAADEDGIHDAAWDAYERACVALGQTHRLPKRSD